MAWQFKKGGAAGKTVRSTGGADQPDGIAARGRAVMTVKRCIGSAEAKENC